MYSETEYLANMVYDAIGNLQGCRFDSFRENRDGSIKVYLYFTDDTPADVHFLRIARELDEIAGNVAFNKAYETGCEWFYRDAVLTAYLVLDE